MELDAQVLDTVRRHVALGEQPCAQIVRTVVDHRDDADAAEVEPLAWTACRSAFAEHLAAQAVWPDVTDSDRLTHAFRDLNIAGIVARENFTCCQNCGHAEIGDEVVDGERPRGYTFYHRQDAESGVDGGGIYLAYGTFERDTDPAEVGQAVADAVRARGLDVDWDGDVRTRIKVRMAWQRRRVGRLAAFAPEDGPTLVAVRRLDPWYGPFALTDGPLPATRLAALCLPWLPARTRLRVEPDGGEAMVLRRERDRLIAAYDDGRPERAVDRTRAGELLGLDAGSSVHSGGSGRGGHSGPPSLDVTYDCRLGSEAAEVPLDLFESVALLRAMPPRTGSWACFGGAAGGVIQIRWEDGRLWLETPDPSTRTSLGRYVSLTEAEGMVSMLAIEGRVAVSELDGLQRIAWD